MARIINQAGLDLIKHSEGLRLEAYDDGVGVQTIGYGHTLGVKKGDTCSQHKADMLLEGDLVEAEETVCEFVKVPLTDNQFAALVCFVFNVGETAFKNSTLLRKLNEGGYGLVPACLKSWVFGRGGKALPGLVKRRAAEAELWSRI